MVYVMKKLLVSLVLFVLFSISAKCNIVYYYDDAGGYGVYTSTYVSPIGTSIPVSWSTVGLLNGYVVKLENESLTYTEISDIEREARSIEDAINSMNQQQQDLIDLMNRILRQIYDTAMGIIRRMT